MPVAPRHPYQDIPYVGTMGVDPFIGTGTLAGSPQYLQELARVSPWLARWLRRVPESVIIGDQPRGETRIWGITRQSAGGGPITIELNPYQQNPIQRMVTLAHEGVHALRAARPQRQQPGFGLLPTPLAERLVETASRSGRFPRGYTEQLTRMYTDMAHATKEAQSHAALELFAGELARRQRVPQVFRFTPAYKNMVGDMLLAAGLK